MNSSTVLDGLARYLADAGLVRYSPTGVYPAGGLPAVVFGAMPDAPADVVAINVYDDSRDRDDWNPDVYVQLRFRTAGRNPSTTDDLGDGVFNELHLLDHTVFPGGVRLLIARRVIRAPHDQDAAGRYSRPDSYRLTINP